MSEIPCCESRQATSEPIFPAPSTSTRGIAHTSASPQYTLLPAFGQVSGKMWRPEILTAWRGVGTINHVLRPRAGGRLKFRVTESRQGALLVPPHSGHRRYLR